MVYYFFFALWLLRQRIRKISNFPVIGGPVRGERRADRGAGRDSPPLLQQPHLYNLRVKGIVSRDGFNFWMTCKFVYDVKKLPPNDYPFG
jgi:hypothetical protein